MFVSSGYIALSIVLFFGLFPVSCRQLGQEAEADDSIMEPIMIASPEYNRINGNHLKGQRSEYLLQHAFNPLDWYPWGEEALERAKTEKKPIFLSIGYSSCHWCHVMEHEVFEKDDVAEFMNERFISIKVDREERPDIDAIYMDAVTAMTGSGGWPMSVFLTPELQPFYGGTYFPHSQFMSIVQQLHQKYMDERASIYMQARKVVGFISEKEQACNVSAMDIETVEKSAETSKKLFDDQWGGFRGQMKFPTPIRWCFLLDYYRKTNDARIGEMVEKTLDEMGSGGIHDQIGGGFHRYTVEHTWLVPHFEKMLYDNAQLASLYIDAYSVYEKNRYREIARDSLDFMIAEMSGEEGAFYASFDADSGGEEGSYYVWTPDELTNIAGERDGSLLSYVYGITERGNFEGKSIPTLRADFEKAAGLFDRSEEEISKLLESYRPQLREFREKRIKPKLDRKIVASWNGLALSAMSKGYSVFGDKRYLDAARNAWRYLENVHMQKDGSLYRVSNGGHAEHCGVLDDYAFMANGLIDLYQVSGDIAYFANAGKLVDYAVEHFSNPNGSFYHAAVSETPLGRRVEVFDSVKPSGYSAMLEAMLKLFALSGETRYLSRLKEAMVAHSGKAADSGIDMAGWHRVALMLLGPYYDVVITGRPDERKRLVETFRKLNPSHAVLNVFSEDGASEKEKEFLPAVQGKRALDGKATVFICKYGNCQKPISDPQQMKRAIMEGWQY